MGELVEPDEFNRTFQNYEVGNKESALYMLNNKIENEEKTFDNKEVTLELLKERYDGYCVWWKSKFGKTDPRYGS